MHDNVNAANGSSLKMALNSDRCAETAARFFLLNVNTESTSIHRCPILFFLWPLSPGTRIYQHYLAIILIATLLMRARIAWVLNFHQCLLSAHVFSYLLCKVNGYLCLCPPEYSGVHCDVKSSGCKGNKCASGSTCVNTPSGHDCVCPIGYEGTFCETKSNVRWWHFPSSYVFVKMLVLICL